MFATRTRVWVAGTVLLAVLISVAGWFLLISPKRAEAAELEQQTEATELSNQQLEARIAQLKEQFAELPQYQAELAAIQQAMPGDPALPTLVRTLDDMADRHEVTLMSLAPGQPAAVQQPTPTAPAEPAESAEDGAAEGEGADADAAGDAAAEDADPAAADPAAPADPAATATPVGAGMVLVSVPVTLTTVGDFFASEMFLKDLQAEMTRAFLVQNLSITTEPGGEASGGKPATENGDITTTISGSVFVLKTADAAPAAPATTTTP
ncbi:hypothetical protein ACFP6A_13775 [Quadrisphaera sp. GCM10027208]|uniref:hypothetical protein n=1 Tax=Quadrisphaera sp. GCM10027208 TaxID=3273423 RepID=UPI00361A5204